MTIHSTQDYHAYRFHQSPTGSGSPVEWKPTIAGIWRLQVRLHGGTWCDIFAAQPADASGSPRFDYVVKIANCESTNNAEAFRQLRVETELAAEVKHPHLIPVVDAELHGSRPFLVMPRLNAHTLEQVGATRCQPVPVVLWWARQTAQALRAVHTAGWVHGDVKPENILVDARGHVTLIDLGFAQRIGASLNTNYQGTPSYSAPELVSGSQMSPATDIYSLGQLLTEMLQDSPTVPQSVTDLTEQMRASQPSERPQTDDICQQLLKLEIETLHLHIAPNGLFPRKAA